MPGRHDIYRMTLEFELILILMFYCTSGIRAMSIQNESDHTQLDDKGNNKITELRAIIQRESQNS